MWTNRIASLLVVTAKADHNLSGEERGKVAAELAFITYPSALVTIAEQVLGVNVGELLEPAKRFLKSKDPNRWVENMCNF